MPERAVFALLIILGGVLAWAAVNRLLLRRAAAHAPHDPILSGILSSRPTVVYFTTPFCDPCKTQQMPALRQLQAELGETLQVVQIDATEQPDAADRWGVFSAPTTFVLDRTQTPRHVNRGVASAERLRQQIEDVA
ncbi:MAG TPA: thioredoxin family protein [Aggregatilineales bacterium]|nr:thioredoxin family protein [Anaerolineales bacterium]HRE47452.1 thioredoxin family protein [Aggregatilineales bacterium]